MEAPESQSRSGPSRDGWRPMDGVLPNPKAKLLGHEDVSTTMICTHVLRQGGLGVRSPLDEDEHRTLNVEPGAVRSSEFPVLCSVFVWVRESC
jgi:hypothetical protein